MKAIVRFGSYLCPDCAENLIETSKDGLRDYDPRSFVLKHPENECKQAGKCFARPMLELTEVTV